MSGTQAIAEDRRDRIIEDSIRDHRPGVLTRQADCGWQTYRTQFISGSRPSGAVVLKIDPSNEQSVDRLPNPGESLGVTFRAGHMKCMFSSILENVHPGSDGSLLTLKWPDEVQRLQRRVYERVQPPPGMVVAVRFWRFDALSASPGGDRAARYGQLEDISAGGIRVQTTDAGTLDTGCIYRCAFSPRPQAPSLVIDARLRHHEHADRGRVSLGFQFVGLETTSDGRKVLNRLVKVIGQFQRARQGDRRLPKPPVEPDST